MSCKQKQICPICEWIIQINSVKRMNGFIEKFRLKSTFSDIVSSFIITDEKFKAILYTKLYAFRLSTIWFMHPVWSLKAPVLIHCKWIGGKQQEQQPGYSWEFSHLSSAEVDTSYCFLNTWRWLNNVFEFKFSYNQPKHRHYDHRSSDESERNNVVIVSIKTINRCPHVITHLREVTYSM